MAIAAALHDERRGIVVQDHVHPGEAAGGGVLLLPVEVTHVMACMLAEPPCAGLCHRSVSANLVHDPHLRRQFQTWRTNGFGELGCALVTKMMMLGAAIQLFNDQMKRVDAELRSESDEALRDLVATHTVYTFRDQMLPYDVLVAADSFVFEAQSTYELLEKFVKGFFRRILRERVTDLAQLLATQDQEIEWVATLNSHRDELIRNTAPWLAFEVSWVPKRRFQLLLEKRVASEDPADLIPYKDFQSIYLGLRLALPCLNKLIMDRITAFEQKHL